MPHPPSARAASHSFAHCSTGCQQRHAPNASPQSLISHSPLLCGSQPGFKVILITSLFVLGLPGRSINAQRAKQSFHDRYRSEHIQRQKDLVERDTAAGAFAFIQKV